jgi:hypothetical protein
MVSMGGNRGAFRGGSSPVRASGYPDLIERVSEGRPVLFGRRTRGRGDALPNGGRTGGIGDLMQGIALRQPDDLAPFQVNRGND